MAVSSSGASALPRERNLILASLLLLAAAAWALLVWQASNTGTMGVSSTMGLSAPLFLAIWVVMMIAMMFPTTAPMILTFARVQAGKRHRRQVFVPTWIFVAAYLVVWIAFGAISFAVAVGAEQLADEVPWFMENASRIAGAVLVAAGFYQFSPLKRRCLTKCRSPLSFILGSWRDGRGGAFLMGLQHGMYCLGCCWLLFVILFPLGVMNVAAMAVITLLIFAEKSLPIGRRAAQLAAAVLVMYGVMVFFLPQLLPTTGTMSGGM
jgi:predicted metal-binding membrane protein